MLVSLLISLLLNLGWISSQAEWDSLDQDQKNALEQRIIIEQVGDL